MSNRGTIDTIYRPRSWELAVRPLLDSLLRRLALVMLMYWHRHRSRQALSLLNEGQLRDIGLSRDEAEKEWQKPFWR